MKNLKKIIAAAVIGVTMLSVNVFAAANQIPNGSVILGDKAFGLDYANNSAHQDEISEAVVESGGKVYIKLFEGEQYIDNVTNKSVSSSTIKVGTYKDDNGTKVIDEDITGESDSLEIISIE